MHFILYLSFFIIKKSITLSQSDGCVVPTYRTRTDNLQSENWRSAFVHKLVVNHQLDFVIYFSESFKEFILIYHYGWSTMLLWSFIELTWLFLYNDFIWNVNYFLINFFISLLKKSVCLADLGWITTLPGKILGKRLDGFLCIFWNRRYYFYLLCMELVLFP